MRSAAWQSLTSHEKASYLELKRRFDGHNNGMIGLGERELSRSLHSSRETARRALHGLIEKGFIRIAKPSGFQVKCRVATEWRLTELKCDVTGELPTKEFARWCPLEKQTTGASHSRTGASQVKSTAIIGVNHV